ncbi:lytic transglycosylase domain-containing protein [Piscinibacter koreensis]|uniref:Transglycosylase SLT domain-containing protein n=1 Tax=Piscinibacter koreensis TaxID=2742824 RepID=A0A7Y6TXM7_9BURK|nr:lytic transglycosylase domain-containing protein [Schlegelella koreensis]NUZ07220.1 transglycosylase SLT domain-containing protein [Schlegelella koreensis]
MTLLDRLHRSARTLPRATLHSLGVFTKDVGRGLLEVSHNSFAVIGFVLVSGVVFAGTQPEIRHELEARALGWLQERHGARPEPVAAAAEPAAAEPLVFDEPDAIARATAADPKQLSRQQAAVAQWLSRRYKVALEPVSRLVQEAWQVGARSRLDPTLILAIMAIESSFNPFAQSAVGAQGLMQVMTKVHNDKYEPFGGRHAAFDPVTNLRVGVQVLKECIARAGSVEGGLRFYVGAANLADDGGYAGKVLNEQSTLRQVAGLPSLAPRVFVRAPAAEASPAATPAIDPASAAPVAENLPPEQVALLR